MVKVPANAVEAQEYAGTLVLDGNGLPPTSEPAPAIATLLQHQVTVGKDIFTMDRFLKWNDKVREEAVVSAAGRNAFSTAGPCPVSEEEFGKYAPEIIHCAFFSEQEFKQLVKAFPAASGQPAGIGQFLRCKKKWGEAKGPVNPKTGKRSGGRYGSGSYGWWFGGQVAMQIDIPDKAPAIVKGRPTINMALEGTKIKKDGSNGPMTGEGEGEDEEE